MQKIGFRHTYALVFACALFLICALTCVIGANSAFAVSHADTKPDEKLAAAQEKVEQTAKDLDEAYDKVKDLEKKIEKAQSRLDQVKKELPAQEEQAREAWCALYKASEEAPTMIDLLFSADSVNSFFQTYEYMEAIQESNVEAIEKLSDMKTELTNTNAELSADLEEAKKDRDAAYVALEKAKAERQKIQEDALAAAEAAARAQAAKEKKEREAKEKAAKEKKAKEKAKAEKDKDDKDETKAIDDGNVNWDMSKDKFVSIWTKRIDNYLEGSKMAGTGKYYAKAAWNYGVDPRWSPAISCIESSKGKICFKPYNAWGWGSCKWSSWSEAINDHVKGLARGYGYTISVTAAQKYCPPNWRNWYNNVSGEMRKI